MVWKSMARYQRVWQGIVQSFMKKDFLVLGRAHVAGTWTEIKKMFH